MTIKSKEDFINNIKSYGIKTEYVLIKPNWVSSKWGEYTEPEILDWLLEALPGQKKIIIESYTPWRGGKLTETDNHKSRGVTLDGGKEYWDYYRSQDKRFLYLTGNLVVLNKYRAEYLNVTNEVWAGKCVRPDAVEKILADKNKTIKWTELYSYIPQRIFEIRNKTTLISLSKIKTEDDIPEIYISISVKNLFGLIPHPSRWIPFHGKNHETVSGVVKDLYTLYTCLFSRNVWIAEGIKTLVINYCGLDQKVIKDKNLLFTGMEGIKVDKDVCKAMGIDYGKVPYLNS